MSRQWRSDDTDPWVYGFGSGADGSSYVVPANEGCSGTSESTSLTLAAAGSFSNGDLVLIHQSRGTGAGNWELNKIISGAGTTSITLAHSLQNTYTDSGNSQAQIIELKEYENLTTGNITAANWNGSKGGVIAFLDKGSCSINGTLSLTGASGNGYVKGTQVNSTGRRGEGTSGPGQDASTAANGNGGGGGGVSNTLGTNKYGGGGGGGNANAGTNGQTNTHEGASATGGSGGTSAGTAQLTTAVFGGGGGSSKDRSGGNGGGIAFIFCSDITITGTISLNGQAGESRASGDLEGAGGGGAGGSCLFKCITASLGTIRVTSAGGSGGTAPKANGGAGSEGRIHLDYSGSFTGTTTPTIDSRLDATIVPFSAGGASPMFFSGGVTIS